VAKAGAAAVVGRLRRRQLDGSPRMMVGYDCGGGRAAS
jgi:hypothetical protein